MLNKSADILPAYGLGGISLGKRITEYSDLLERYDVAGKLSYEQISIYSTRYSFENTPIEIDVDTRIGVIYKVSALEGYYGSLLGQIKIGSPANEILSMGRGFYYDECDEAILSKEIPGVAIELNEDDPLPNEIKSLFVKYISVFLPEVFKP